MLNVENTYWNDNGKYQNQSDFLRNNQPHDEELDDYYSKEQAKAYRNFEKAIGLYHDFYNNGLDNTNCDDWNEILNDSSINKSTLIDYDYALYCNKNDCDDIVQKLEIVMDSFIQPVYAFIYKRVKGE